MCIRDSHILSVLVREDDSLATFLLGRVGVNVRGLRDEADRAVASLPRVEGDVYKRHLIISAKGGTKDAARAIRFFGYTKTYRRTLRKVRILNALPRSWRGPLIGLYNSLAWRIARKGL